MIEEGDGDSTDSELGSGRDDDDEDDYVRDRDYTPTTGKNIIISN